MTEQNFASVNEALKEARPSRPQIDIKRLIRFLQAQPDVEGAVHVQSLQYIEDAGGSNGIALFAAEYELNGRKTTQDLVLRYAPGEQLLKQKRFADEFHTLAAVQRHGIPAPQPRWMDPTGTVLGYPFLIMTRVEGRAPAPQMMYSTGLLAEVKPQARKSMLLDAVGFHGRLRAAAIGPSDVPHLVQRGQGDSAIERELSWWLKEAQLIMRQGDPRLTYLTSLHRWMVEHQPQVRAPTLVHGDAQIANLMFRDERFVAALDWELSYLGHGEADLALLVHLLQAHMPDDPIDGVPSETEVISRYEAECGAQVEHWAFFQLFNLVKVSTIMCMTSHGMDAELADAMWLLNAEDREITWERARAAL